MSVKLQTYSLELKAQAVRMAVEEGPGVKETAKRYFALQRRSTTLESKRPRLEFPAHLA